MWPAKPKELPTPVLKGWVIPEAKPPHLGPRRTQYFCTQY